MLTPAPLVQTKQEQIGAVQNTKIFHRFRLGILCLEIMLGCFQHFWRARKTYTVILTPVCLLPLILLHYDSKECRCAYGVAMLAVYWITEALPVATTALLPVIIFPLLGIMPASDLCSAYITDTSVFFMGCLSFSVAMETTNLDRRLGLKYLLLMGTNPRWMLLSFMLPTWFLSMWFGSSSTTTLMIPVVCAILTQLRRTKVKRSPSLLARKAAQHVVNMTKEPTANDRKAQAKSTPVYKFAAWAITPESKKCQPQIFPSHQKKKKRRYVLENLPILTKTQRPVPQGHHSQDEESIQQVRNELDIKLSPATPAATFRGLSKGTSLCLAYAASIGSMGALSGSKVNQLMHDHALRLFQEHGLESSVTFATWLMFAVPCSAICLLLAWLWLSLLFFGPKEWIKKRQRDKVNDTLLRETLLRQYKTLGPITFTEKVVIWHFVVLICLWLTRKPPVIPGWGSLFPPEFVGESTCAILVSVSLFVFPAERPQVFCWRRSSVTRGRKAKYAGSILEWRALQTRFPWGVVMLLGGGHALTHACQVSGLSQWFVQELTSFGQMAPWQLAFALTAIIAMATEILSNDATASLLLPILSQHALDLGINPLYLLFPCSIATAFTFMLPIATPSNAIVFATGFVEVKDMVIAGSVLNVLCVAVINLAVNTWGKAFFDLDTFPPQFSGNLLNTSALAPNITTIMTTSVGAQGYSENITSGDLSLLLK